MNTKDYKDFVTINTKDGEKNAELVSRFEIENIGDFVIYKLDDKYYGAKYKFDGQNTSLITDLTDEEKKILNEIFIKLGVE